MKIVQCCIRCGEDSFEGKIFTSDHSEMIRNCPTPLIGIQFEYVVCDFCRTSIGTNFADNILQEFISKKNELKNK